MKAGLYAHAHRIVGFTAVVSAWIFAFGGCSTTETKPAPLPTVSPPEYISVTQPGGFDISDLSALLRNPKALSADAVKTCDADFQKLRNLTLFEDELKQGAREFVKQDPVFYHWCFYGKIMELETAIKSMDYVDEKQKKVLETYAFLVPLARAYLAEYHDSRYLRWAVRHYRHLSEWVFYRKLEQTPKLTSELVEVTNPFGLWREPAAAPGSVLEKYSLGKPATNSLLPASPTPESAAAPATAPLAREPAQQAPVADSKKLETYPATDPVPGELPVESDVPPIPDGEAPK